MVGWFAFRDASHTLNVYCYPTLHLAPVRGRVNRAHENTYIAHYQKRSQSHNSWSESDYIYLYVLPTMSMCILSNFTTQKDVNGFSVDFVFTSLDNNNCHATLSFKYSTKFLYMCMTTVIDSFCYCMRILVLTTSNRIYIYYIHHIYWIFEIVENQWPSSSFFIPVDSHPPCAPSGVVYGIYCLWELCCINGNGHFYSRCWMGRFMWSFDAHFRS